MRKAREPKKRHYRNEAFLKALGAHCARIRKQAGYSMDRLSKESEQLSTSVIARLESGDGAVTLSSLYRYALALGLQPKALWDIPLTGLEEKESSPVQGPTTPLAIPVYSLKAAAGYFGEGEEVEIEGNIQVSGNFGDRKALFVARAVGRSMEPMIHSGDLLLFRANPGGSRQGKIVLAQYRGAADPETGGSFTVKKYTSTKVLSRDGTASHQEITLSPLNPDFEPIVITSRGAGSFRIVAELLRVLPPAAAR